MRRGLIVGATIGLVFVVGFAGYLTLQACGLAWPGWAASLAWCKAPAQIAAEARLAALKERNRTLQREILYSERELAQLQCDAKYEVAEAPRPPAPEPPPPPPPPPPSTLERKDGIDEDAWRAKDVSVLEGCWELDSNYKVQNVQTRAVTHFNQWSMCFSAGGAGEESMTATNGTKCQGPVTGTFDRSGRLNIVEPRNLPCTNDSFIFRRELTCTLSKGSTASCSVVQPEKGLRDTVKLRRSTRGQ